MSDVDDEYLAMLLEDCEYAIAHEEGFADGGPPIEDWRDIILELQERRGIKMKICSTCHLGGDIVLTCPDCDGKGFIKETS